ncbi:MAG: hypothetical protein NTY01_11240 [Verrucomicrobia bacterium]|nr:hypothetical protein [Verrucomicrobiota bacterium]
MNTSRLFQIISAFAVVATFAAAAERNNITILHRFKGAGGCDALTLSGSTLYGMTSGALGGGDSMVFKINCDGSGYTILHSFAKGSDDWSHPVGLPTLSGSTLYGVTSAAGMGKNQGVVFKINTDGTGYANIHSFAGGNNDGSSPYGSPVLSGSNLYGVTLHGGSGNVGVLFKINTDGSGFTILHSFASNGNDGYRPSGPLILSGSTLYGMTESGGVDHAGVVFKINCDGSGYTILHSFSIGRRNEGCRPTGSLTLSGSSLYGLTRFGGSKNLGVLFKVNTDGSGFANLHSFISGSDDGMWPYGSLTLSGTSLFGVTRNGGSRDMGVAFKINSDGSGFTNIHSFAGVLDRGDSDNIIGPSGWLTLSGTSLYGVTQDVMKFGVQGVVFKLDVAP